MAAPLASLSQKYSAAAISGSRKEGHAVGVDLGEGLGHRPPDDLDIRVLTERPDHGVIARLVLAHSDAALPLFGRDVALGKTLIRVEEVETLVQSVEAHVLDDGQGIAASVDTALDEISGQGSPPLCRPADDMRTPVEITERP
jgi:hypothetical protein